jgi:serine/threonine-protein kinase
MSRECCALEKIVKSRLSLRTGKSLWGGYQLRRWLGKGSFGQVWEAVGPDGKQVALKFLRCGSDLAAAQEVRTILNVRKVKHPNLIRIDRVWADRGYLVIVMELADGSLADLLAVCRSDYGTPLPQKQVCHFLKQAAEAIDFLNAFQHRIGTSTFGIQHCDIKPSNLLVSGETLKVSDFGLASLISASVMPHRRAGTFAYAAPEVFQGQLSKWTDQYALAASYCELRLGKPPFSTTPPRCDTVYVPPEPDVSALTDAERPIISRALAPSPWDRWKSCADMMAQLSE